MNNSTLVLCDIQSNFLAARKEFGQYARLDFVKLIDIFEGEYATEDEDYYDAVAYTVVSPLHDDRKFIGFLKNRGFKVLKHFAATKKDHTGTPKVFSRNWLSRMIREFMPLIAINKYDQYVIVSGSGRFISLVNAIHNQGKKVTVIAFKSSLHPILAEKADNIIYLDKSFLYDEQSIKAQKKAELISNETVDRQVILEAVAKSNKNTPYAEKADFWNDSIR